ncbi:hypothetical protein [Photorhabdus sp. SF281]|uniref:hypothetical protein n=1 Tax=Photorhabdus sp. SF281 TaxID=3459527 RepID=UPI004044F4F7
MQPTRPSRIQILKTDEIDELYRRPEFSQTEREEYFALNDTLLGVLWNTPQICKL